MRVKTWRVIDRGAVPDDAETVAFACVCGATAELPVRGRPLAQSGPGVIFDGPPGAVPPVVQCRRCRRILTTEATGV